MTPASPGVLDASVAVKCFLDEEGSAAARHAVADRADWIAPDLIFLEVASVALKSLRRGLLGCGQGERMVAGLGALLTEAVAAEALADTAFQLAADHGFSAYDAAYVALARERATVLLTADLKLVNFARAAGLGAFVAALTPA